MRRRRLIPAQRREPDAVPGDAAVADLAPASSDEPGDGAFDPRSVLPVGLGERRGQLAGGDQPGVGLHPDVGLEPLPVVCARHTLGDCPSRGLGAIPFT